MSGPPQAAPAGPAAGDDRPGPVCPCPRVPPPL